MTLPDARDYDDEIDLAELALAIWARWPAVVLPMVLGGVVSGYLSTGQPVLFQAQSTFDVLQNGQPVGNGVLDQMMGQTRAEQVAADLDMANDARFVGAAIGSTAAATAAYQSSVVVARTKNGSISVSVTHADPTAAADLANAVVERTLRDIEEGQAAELAAKRQELARDLSAALGRLRQSQSALEAYQPPKGISARSRDEFASLERAALEAEAEYNVLLEEVRAQANSGGAEVVTRVYQQASVPAAPIPSRTSLTLALGPILGLVAGAALALLLSWRSGRLYSATSLQSQAAARMTIRVARNEETELGTATGAALLLALANHPSRLAVIASTAPELDARAFALGLGKELMRHGRPVMFVAIGDGATDAAGLSPDTANPCLRKGQVGELTIIEPASDASIPDLLMSPGFGIAATSAASPNDLVLVSVSHDWAATTLQALSAQSPYLVALAQPRLTRRKTLEQLRSAVEIDTLAILA